MKNTLCALPVITVQPSKQRITERESRRDRCDGVMEILLSCIGVDERRRTELSKVHGRQPRCEWLLHERVSCVCR
jgi:hypothetical protein